jgi:hypothetical protein
LDYATQWRFTRAVDSTRRASSSATRRADAKPDRPPPRSLPLRPSAYDRAGMSETLWAVIVGGLLTGGAAVGAQLLAARFQTNAARDAYRQQDRVWHRDQRLEAHHAFLNQVNSLVQVIGAIDRAGPVAPDRDVLLAEVEKALAKTVDAFNRVELVCSPPTYDLAMKILVAADAQRLMKPGEFPAVMLAIAEASRNYREAAKAELRA